MVRYDRVRRVWGAVAAVLVALAGILLINVGQAGAVDHALTGTCTASGVYETYVAARGCDGLEETNWVVNSYGSVWLMVDVGQAEAVSSVRLLYGSSQSGGVPWVVQSSDDGVNWTERGSGTGPTLDQTVAITETSARYWRLYVPDTVNGWYSVYTLALDGAEAVASASVTDAPTAAATSAPTATAVAAGGFICATDAGQAEGVCMVVALDAVALGELSGLRAAVLVCLGLFVMLATALLLLEVAR